MHISDMTFYRLYRAQDDRVTRELEQHRRAAERVSDLKALRSDDDGLDVGNVAESKAGWPSRWPGLARSEIR